MTDIKDLLKFFENPVTSEIMENNKTISEISATRMMFIAEMLDIEDDKEYDRDNLKELAKILREESRSLMRNASMGTVLSDSPEREVVIRVNSMIDNIVDGCKKVFGENFRIKAIERSDAYVKINEKMLKFCIIGFIRKLCSVAGDTDFEIQLGSRAENGMVKIFVYSDVEIPEEEKTSGNENQISRQINYYDRNYDVIRMFFDRKLDLQMNDDESSLYIVIPETEVNEDSKELEFKSPLVHMDKDDFSDYLIMLTDAYES